MFFNRKKSVSKTSDEYFLESLKNSYFIYSCKINGEVTYVSPSVANILGYSKNEFLKLIEKSGHFFSMSLNQGFPSKKSLNGDRTDPYEIHIIHKDGRPRWFEVSEFPLYDENGAVDEVECIFHNISEKKRADLGLKANVEKLRKALAGTIQAMAHTVEAKDAYTAGHQHRVANLARAVAQKMDIYEEQVDGIRMAGVIHDLGKISIPAEILSKPSKLSPLEFSLIQTHSQTGYDILKGIDFQWPIARIVLQHHERLDGSGYPYGIKGDEILIEARILAVSDVVEAMTTHRPYRASLGLDAALEEITKNKNILYDAAVVDTIMDLIIKKGFRF